MAEKMRIDVSIADKGVKNIYHKGQKVKFINVLNEAVKSASAPTKQNYEVSDITNYTAILNYENYESIGGGRSYTVSEGYAPVYKSGFQTLDVFKREITTKIGDKVTYNKLSNIEREETTKEEAVAKGYYFRLINGASYYPMSDYDESKYGKYTIYYPTLYREITTKNVEIMDKALTPLELVGNDINSFNFKDFNITNDRVYQYVLYPTTGDDKLIREEVIVHTKWDAWSITELHPADQSGKKFYATDDDVWLFNLNLSSGAQEQNMARNEQQTLGQFPRYIQGRKNYISSSISCLLGSEVIPASYVKKNGKMIYESGYIERRIFDFHPTSNEKIDMLKAWRKLVFSNNPKLLKDRAGQSFLVTITQNSNQPYDGVVRQPNTISFSWTQIGSTDDISVLNVN